MKSMRPIGLWMLCLAGLVFLMAVIESATWLVDTGLWIVDWRMVNEIVPPTNDAAWIRDFQILQTMSPYRYITRGMTLAQYRHIFYWEWFSRLWSREVLGVALFVPLAVFAARGYINRRIVRMLGVVFALAAIEGLLDWYMVHSGLKWQPAVAHYYLAAHLALALAIYASLLWDGLSLIYPIHLMRGPGPEIAALKQHALAGLALVAITMVWGVFVAGLRAGLIYNSFPLMGRHLMPPDWNVYQPTWLNFFANPPAVQFAHRFLAMLTGVTLLVFVYRTWKVKLPESATTISMAIGLAVPVQIVLGVSTLTHHVPVWMGALHQAGAITVMTLVLLFLFVLRRPRAGTVLEIVQGASPPPRLRMAPAAPDTQNRDSTGSER